MAFQGNEARGMQIYLTQKKYSLTFCHSSGELLDLEGDQPGTYGTWIIKQQNGNDQPNVWVQEDWNFRFNIWLSDTFCSRSDWKSYWKRKVVSIEFTSQDDASVEFRMGMYYTRAREVTFLATRDST